MKLHLTVDEMMNQAKRKKLEAAGWKFGTASDFLALTPAEKAYVEMKLSLARELQKERKAKHLTRDQTMVKITAKTKERILPPSSLP